MAGGIRLCPDGTVPLVVCDDCKALTRAADAAEHEEWHARLVAGRAEAGEPERPPTFGDPGPPHCCSGGPSAGHSVECHRPAGFIPVDRGRY